MQTSFLSWTHLAIVLGAWVVFLARGAAAASRRRSPWPVIAAVGGVVVLRCIVTLLALSFTGPGGYWFAFWTDPTRRTVYITIAFALFVWVFVAAGWALVDAARRSPRDRRRARRPSAPGSRFPRLVVALIGLEPALTLWNDQMGLLPWGLARILGHHRCTSTSPATPRGAPPASALVLVVVGVLLALPYGRADRRAEPEAAASADLMS